LQVAVVVYKRARSLARTHARKIHKYSVRIKQTHRHCADVQFKRRSTDQTAFNLRLFIATAAASAAVVVAGSPVSFSTLDDEHNALQSDEVGHKSTVKFSLSTSSFTYSRDVTHGCKSRASVFPFLSLDAVVVVVVVVVAVIVCDRHR